MILDIDLQRKVAPLSLDLNVQNKTSFSRSADSRAMAMMKRLGNVTRIMQNGK